MTYDDGFADVRRRRDVWPVRALRWCSGVLAGGVVVLAGVIAVVAYLSSDRDFPGPGGESVAAHVAGAEVVVGLQVVADRRRGGTAALASTAVFAVTALLLWTQWWT